MCHMAHCFWRACAWLKTFQFFVCLQCLIARNVCKQSGCFTFLRSLLHRWAELRVHFESRKFLGFWLWSTFSKLAKSWVLLVYLCFIRYRQPWWLPGQYGAGTRPMAASSGFEWSPGCAPSGDVPKVVPPHPHGHRNGQWFACIFRSHRFCCRP